MINGNTKQKSNKQIEAILNYQIKLSIAEGRSVPLYEAIADWIALGYAEHYRKQVLKLAC